MKFSAVTLSILCGITHFSTVSRAQCTDSPKAFRNGGQLITCDDVVGDLDLCVDRKVRKNCRVTCETCNIPPCTDIGVPFEYKNDVFTCYKISGLEFVKYCKKRTIKKKCPLTCEIESCRDPCEDMKRAFIFKRKEVICTDIFRPDGSMKNWCKSKTFTKNCPSICNPNCFTKVPSMLPSMSPLTMYPVTPTQFPSTSPSLSQPPTTSPIGPTPSPIIERCWTQFGQDIDGESSHDWSGGAISLYSDGNTAIVAIGAYRNSENALNSGHLRVYHIEDNGSSKPEWEKLGQDIDGTNAADSLGYSVSLLRDGKWLILAAGGHSSNIFCKQCGHVKVFTFDYIGNIWTQLGETLGGSNSKSFGSSVSLAATSKSWNLAVGSRNDAGMRGSAKVFSITKATTGTWSQLGQTLYGENTDAFGQSISLDKQTGVTLAVGTEYNDGGGFTSGHVRVFDIDPGAPTPTWIQVGADIDGDNSNDKSGVSVSLANSGNFVAIGAIGNDDNGSNSGQVKVYKRVDGSWTQIGQDLNGLKKGDEFGQSVSLSDNGSTLAVGSPRHDAGTTDNGLVRVYTFDESDSQTLIWEKEGEDITGENYNDRSGIAVSIDETGTTLAIGANSNDDNGFNSGHVRVYRNTCMK